MTAPREPRRRDRAVRRTDFRCAGRRERWRSSDAAREEGLAIARETLVEVRDIVQGVQVSAPFGRVQYALDVFSVL